VRFRAVFFDAGGTLLDPSPSFHGLFAATLAGRGYHLDPEEIRRNLDTIPSRFVQAAEERELWTTTDAGSQRFWFGVYDVFLRRVGLPTDDGLQDALYGAFTTLENYALYPETTDVLDELSGAGLELGLISNFEPWLDDLLVYLGVRDRFGVRVVSGVEGIEKPDPRIFRIALERAGRPPEDVAYVGDVPAIDVDPAEALGMTPVLIDRRGRHAHHTGLRITDLRALPALLGRTDE
jgi:putative hydrolase of the HAD superfamily